MEADVVSDERDRATIEREDTKAMLAGKIGANGYREGSVDGSRAMVAVDSRSRSRCNCCGKRSTHVGLGDGLALMDGCELRVRRWVRDGRRTYADRQS
jgi:hypothetical protein